MVEAVAAAIQERLGLRDGETSADGSLTFERVPCLGMCEHAPNALYGEKTAGDLTVEQVDDFLNGRLPEPEPKIYGSPRLKLARAEVVDPDSLSDYEAHGGYADLRKAMQSTPEEIIALLKESAVLGRGGAMFPIGLKWAFTRSAPGDPSTKHVIANADESEPGTFKDRAILEEDPFSLIEALTIAGYAVGAENGWIFVRGEYMRSYRPSGERAGGRRGKQAIWAATCSGARALILTLNCAAALAPTSAAKKRPCLRPSKASAASRASSRLSPPQTAYLTSLQPSTTWRHWSRR